MAIAHSLMFIQVATEEEEKLTSPTFSRKEVTESGPSRPSLIIPHWHQDGSASPSIPIHLICQGCMFIHCTQDGEETSSVCHKQGNKELDSNSSVFIPNPFMQTKSGCRRRMGGVQIWWKSSSQCPSWRLCFISPSAMGGSLKESSLNLCWFTCALQHHTMNKWFNK